MISALASHQRLVLGQIKVAAKSNEITAIPDLLELLTLKGATVTIDAMGCQREIAAKIIAKDADYVMALKGNQSSLRDDVELFSTTHKESPFKDITVSRHLTLEKGRACVAWLCHHAASRPDRSQHSARSTGSRSATTGRA